MGRRRQHKRDRRGERHQDVFATPAPDYFLTADDSLLGRLAGSAEGFPAPAQTCAECTEFVEDELASRGTCLHPGSGVLAPWSDSSACAFFSARRRPMRVARR